MRKVMVFKLLDGWGENETSWYLDIDHDVVAITSPTIDGAYPTKLQWVYLVSIKNGDDFIRPEDWILQHPYYKAHAPPIINSDDIPKPPDNWRDQVKICIKYDLLSELECCKDDIDDLTEQLLSLKIERKSIKAALKLFH